MEESNLISVIVPVYNAEKYLDECISGVLSQTYRNFELLLVNDGSTDSSLEICRRYAAGDPRVVVIDKPNGGVSSARNAALDVARGEWVMFSDADDYYLPHAFRTLADAVTSAPDIDLAASSCLRLEDGEMLVQCVYPTGVTDKPIMGIVNYALWGHIFRKSIIDAHRMRFPQGISYSEDRLFLFEFALRSWRMATVDERTYVYRIIPTSACRTSNVASMARQQFRAVEKIMELQKIAPDRESADKVRYECEFLVRCVVERTALNRLNLKALRSVKHDLDTICPVGLKTRLPFFAFCVLSRVKGIKRRYFPKRVKA